MRQNTSLAFDVADYDGESVWLILHDALQYTMMLEPAQALAWFGNGLAAGNYCFTHNGTVYYFTLANPIPPGGQLKATTTSFTTHESRSKADNLESGSVSTTAKVGAVSLGTTGAGELNHMSRVSDGSNNTGESGLFAWLNSDAASNTDIPRSNKFSRPYSSGSGGGFLRGFDPDALACLDTVTWRLTANNVYEAPASLGGIAVKGQSYTVTGKFGLAEYENLGLAGGSPWDLFVDADNEDRIKYINRTAQVWWAFNALSASASNSGYVGVKGGAASFGARYKYAVVPVCKISRDSQEG